MGKGSIGLIKEVGLIYLDQVEFERIDVFIGVSFLIWFNIDTVFRNLEPEIWGVAIGAWVTLKSIRKSYISPNPKLRYIWPG